MTPSTPIHPRPPRTPVPARPLLTTVLCLLSLLATPDSTAADSHPQPNQPTLPAARRIRGPTDWLSQPEWPRLLEARKNTDLPTLEQLVADHPGLAQAQHRFDSEPLLPWAAARGASNLLATLLRQHALDWDPPGSPPRHTSALATAALAGQTAAVQQLLDAGADPNAPADSSRLPTLILLLTDWGRRGTSPTEPAARALLHAGANLLLSVPGLDDLLFLPRTDIVPAPGIELLLTNARPEAQHHPLRQTLLHAAALAGATNAIPILVARGLDPNATNALGDSPLRTLAATHPLLPGPNAPPFNSFDPDWTLRHLLLRLPAQHRQTAARQLLAAGAHHDVFSASGLGDLPALQSLIQSHPALLQTQDPAGRTPLHWAVLGDDVPALQTLLRLGADPAATDTNGFTPLHLALTGWHKRTTDALLAARAPLDRIDASGRSPLALATHAPPAVELLLLHHAPPNDPGPRPPLVEAARFLTQDLRDRQRNPSTPDVRSLDYREQPVRQLLAAGARTDLPGPDGRTALDLALTNAALNLVELLVDHGADLNRRRPDGQPAWFTALHAPALSRYHPPIPWELRLASRFPDWLARPLLRRGWMPPWPPVLRLPTLSVLQNLGANLTTTNAAGENALHHIASLGPHNPFENAPTNSLSPLLDAGLSINAPDPQGFTPWLRAWDSGAIRFALTLSRLGANPQATNLAGDSALHLAVRAAARGSLHLPSLLPVLADLHLNPRSTNRDGLSPIDLARQLNLHPLAESLATPATPQPHP